MELNDLAGDGEGEGEDPDDEDVDEGPARIRYINLKPIRPWPSTSSDWRSIDVATRLRSLSGTSTTEYDLFMEHAMARLSNPPDDSYRARFFVTGQPGIDK